MYFVKMNDNYSAPVYEVGDIVTLRTHQGKAFVKGTKWEVISRTDNDDVSSIKYRLQNKDGFNIEILGIFIQISNEDR